MRRVFLTAEWRNLIVLTYPIAREALTPHIPRGVELDLRDGQALVSLVAFQFLNTRVLGIPALFHRDFPEVNLRFYVKRETAGELRRGVVFVKEIVPKWAIATLARTLYHENYVRLPMRWSIDPGKRASYEWTYRGRRNHMTIQAQPRPAFPPPDSLDTFILEHQWGYSRTPSGGCIEYRVERPDWRTYPVVAHEMDVDVSGVYGEEFVEALARPAISTILAEGSAVSVSFGSAIG